MNGTSINLTEFRQGDEDEFAQWQWNPEFMQGISYDVYHPFQLSDWEKMFDNSDSNEEFYFIIRNNTDDKAVGFISLSSVLLKNRNAELGIGIPNPANRGKGYGKEAILLILDFAFNHLGLHKVNLSVHAYNTNAVSLYEKLGFIHEGTNRESVYSSGSWFDQYNYGLLQREYYSSYLKDK